MAKIKLLPPHLISKIAAGEVIERPAFVVKELIENSLDAGSTKIIIDISESGLKKIQVADNGEGMDKKDITEAVKVHTTSKVGEEDDLSGISSFGFRGEAIASIGAVSKMTLKSRTQKESGGVELVVEFGKLISQKPVGMPIGTTVTVEQLFAHVPARKKFLKSSKTEFRHILDVVTKFALAFPYVRFQLVHNGKQIIDLTETQEISRRIKFLFGDLIHNNLIPLNYEEGYIKLHGFVGHPQISTSKPSKQYLYINNRSVTNKLVSSAIAESFQTLIAKDQYVAFVLFVHIPFEAVDVNVHPRKEIVTFFDDKKVFETVKAAILELLLKHNLSFTTIPWKLNSEKLIESFAGIILKQESQKWDITTLGKIKKNSKISQLHNTYLITETNNGIVVIDQHAAHERILYEQFVKEFKNKKKKDTSIKLKESIKLNLSLTDSEMLRSYLDTFKSLGFEIEEFYENSFKVHAVPSLLQDRNIYKTIGELIEELLEKKTISDIDSVSQKMLSFLACRSAVMAGDVLSEKEMRMIIDELEITPNNATCPHGRPAKIEFSLSDIHRIFKRE